MHRRGILVGTGLLGVLLAGIPVAQAAVVFLNEGWKDDGPVVRLRTSTDQVGVGTTTPAGKFHVTGGNAIFDANVGIGTTTPGATLTVNGPMIHRIARVQGYVNDETDAGPLASRVLIFTKTQDDTGIRVAWSDNFRVFGDNAACRWEIKFDGSSCPSPGGLYFDKFDWTQGTISNSHDPSAFVGTCFGLAAGTYTIQAYVSYSPTFFSGDCYTGWSNQLFSLEAEEVY